MRCLVSRRFGGLLGLAVAIAVVWAGPAPAIIGGQPDGEGHPNAGVMLLKVEGFGLVKYCSGSLLSPTEFLTAGHCTDPLTSEGWDADHVFVTFESDLNRQVNGTVEPATQIGTTGWVTHPTFRAPPGDSTAYDDVGVVHLAHRAAKRTPVTLPAAGFLDAQAAGNGLQGHIFETVGYGVNSVDPSLNNPHVTGDEFDKRYVSLSPFMSLTPYFLKLQGNTNATSNTTDVDPATGTLGGTCVGDSGGPAFWTPGSPLQVAVTTATDTTCGSLQERQRLDTASVLAFLAPYR
jgi:secreted trypsin-like serine protease